MKLEIQSQDARTAFEPGEDIVLVAHWELDSTIDALEARLVWFTQGKGTQDIGLAWRHRWDRPPLVGHEAISVVLPEGPYTFSGSLISLSWRLELIMLPGDRGTHTQILIAPEGREVLLTQVE
ncbi:MAG TPA: hypothetical protein PKD54_08790 [Pirellulaceae bacterium]|nr:hypothetical protein [Pirellulaceae bacterium]